MLFELYEDSPSDLHLVNVSARADNGAGEDIMILGFVIAGNGNDRARVMTPPPSR